MIHTLSVAPELSLNQLKKLSRRYAMTGGYELVLPDGLELEQLEHIAEQYIPELQRFGPKTSEFRSSNAYRILQLLLCYPSVPEGLAARICEALPDDPGC